MCITASRTCNLIVARLLTVLWMALWLPGPAFGQERFALLIANENYADAVGKLRNPSNDVQLIRRALLQAGFPEDHIVALKDEDRAGMLDAVDRHVARVNRSGKGTLSLFYYSGHGASNPADNVAYLIPADVKDTTAGMWTRSVSLEDLARRLGQMESAVNVLIIDACRNQLQLPERGAGHKGFVVTPQINGALVAYSTRPGDVASDLGDGGGPYAKALAAQLLQKKELLHVFRDAGRQTQETVLRTEGRRQVPWVEIRGFHHSVHLLEGAPDPPTPHPAAVVTLQHADEVWNNQRGRPDGATVLRIGVFVVGALLLLMSFGLKVLGAEVLVASGAGGRVSSLLAGVALVVVGFSLQPDAPEARDAPPHSEVNAEKDRVDVIPPIAENPAAAAAAVPDPQAPTPLPATTPAATHVTREARTSSSGAKAVNVQWAFDLPAMQAMVAQGAMEEKMQLFLNAMITGNDLYAVRVRFENTGDEPVTVSSDKVMMQAGGQRLETRTLDHPGFFRWARVGPREASEGLLIVQAPIVEVQQNRLMLSYRDPEVAVSYGR